MAGAVDPSPTYMRTPDEARIIERLTRLAPQRDALKLALRPFTDVAGRLDRGEWKRAFESAAPEDILAVKGVTSLFESLVNHLVEMLHAAARLRGLEVTLRDIKPSGPALFAAVHADGGLTINKVHVLTRLYGLRNKLQHASPSVDPEEVLQDVVLLGKTLGGFAQAYVAWLETHKIRLLPEPRR
jgi:hypothetical protein